MLHETILCCAENRRCESFLVTSPLRPLAIKIWKRHGILREGKDLLSVGVRCSEKTNFALPKV